MNELALFAGAGGGILGSVLLGWETICAVEIEPYCREDILRRQRDGVLPLFPIWDDIRVFDGRTCRGVDIITAGFPCQPFSVAGKRTGESDERNLWPETIRVIREVGPRYALLENVPALLTDPYFGTILGELAESGYHARWDCISASAIGADHQRDRLWIVAHASGVRSREEANQGGVNISSENVAYAAGERSREAGEFRRNQSAQRTPRSGEDVADTESTRLEGRGKPAAARTPFGAAGSPSWWLTEPAVGRVADGVAHRVDRLKAIGNGQVPGVVAAAWRLLSE